MRDQEKMGEEMREEENRGQAITTRKKKQQNRNKEMSYACKT